MMNKDMKEIMDGLTEALGDSKVEMTFRDVAEGMDSYFNLIGMAAELIRLIREEETLRKHHRAYLHVRDDILESSRELMAYINAELMKCGEVTRIGYIPSDGYPFAEADEYDSEETVTISKEKYDSMVEDLLTMAELIDMVSDMRTKDVRAIQEFSKFVPAFAAYERNRLSVYREAAKEAEDIIARWEDELEDDYEPEEFYSD